ncbi:MAG TPA: alginate export family protein [Candidatus Sulfotelmatobacter sp.]|nr:alginate export family protein [Candidatus Sulfotelmatobacter sp.]
MSAPPMKTKTARTAVSLFALTAAFAALNGGAALADMPIYADGDFSAAAALSTGMGFFSAPQANFGSGTYKVSQPNSKLATNPNWGEGYLKPELKLTYHNGSIGTIFGDISAIAAGTLGQGEAATYATTYGNPMRVDLEEAYVGYSTDMPFGNPGDTAILTLGRQAFTVGDNFLIGSGTANSGLRSNYWMAPRTAFNGIGTIKLNAEPVRADFFVLQNSVDQKVTRYTDQPKTTFGGLNTEYFITAGTAGADGATNYADRQFYIGATYFNIFDAQSDEENNNGAFSNSYVPKSTIGSLNTYGDRKGMNVFDVHVGGNPFSGPPIVADASLYGEYVREVNTDSDRQVNANAYYIEPGYTLSSVWGKPHFAYRYAHFSGDKNTVTDGTSTKHSYDPLFYSAGPRDFGSWYMGEITGQYMLFNSNEDVHMLSASINPTSQIKVIANYYRFMLDQPQAYSTSSRHFDDEFNLIGEYAYSSATNFALVGAVAKAADGARAAYASSLQNVGDGSNTGIKNYSYQIEGYVTVNF